MENDGIDVRTTNVERVFWIDIWRLTEKVLLKRMETRQYRIQNKAARKWQWEHFYLPFQEKEEKNYKNQTFVMQIKVSIFSFT